MESLTSNLSRSKPFKCTTKTQKLISRLQLKPPSTSRNESTTVNPGYKQPRLEKVACNKGVAYIKRLDS